MKPRGERSARKCNAILEESQVNTGQNTPRKKGETLTLFTGEAVQCEMGTEVFRRFWTPPSNRDEENDIDQVITGDPIGSIPLEWNVEGKETASNAAKRKESPTIESTDKMDLNSCSNWTDALSSHQVIVEGRSNNLSTTCEGAQGITLTSNGEGTVVFPMVLNVVDESGTKEVVAVLSLDTVSPGDTSITSGEMDETSSKTTDENAVLSDGKVGRTYTCGDCKEVFSSIVLYEKHCPQHSSSDPFKCPRCPRRFRRRQDLDRHIVCHPEEAFSCGTCFMKFCDRDALMSHYKTHEPVVSPPRSSEDPDTEILCKIDKFQCSQCERRFSDPDLLQHHEFTHTEGELYPCDQCGRTFREERRLGMHLKLHKKNQRCDKCDEIFTNMFDFNEHMIAHKYEDSKEDFKCVHCKVTFNSFYFLKKHVSSHGMEVHWCGDCGGSGHVGSPTHQSGETNENPLALFVKSESLSGAEDDPLKIEDNSEDCGIITGDIEEQLEIEVQVDDVVIKDEKSSCSEAEAGVSEVVNTKEKTKRQKRKRPGRPSKKTPSKVYQGPHRKVARKN